MTFVVKSISQLLTRVFEKNNINFSNAETQITLAAKNFGGSIQPPQYMITPSRIEDIVTIVKLANQYHLPIACRGFGHASGIQQQATNGFCINMRSLKTIHGIYHNNLNQPVINVDAGASWQEIVDFTLKRGYIPPVYTDWLMLSLGGTMIFGGIGASSFEYGLQCNQLLKADIISADGVMHTAYANQQSELFDISMGGLGQYGIYSNIHLSLIKAPKFAHVYKIIYDDPSLFVEDAFRFAESKQFNALIGHFEPNSIPIIQKRLGDQLTLSPSQLANLQSLKTQWVGILEVTQYSEKSCPAHFDTLGGFNRQYLFEVTYPIHDYLFRIPPILDSELAKEDSIHEELALIMPYDGRTIELINEFLSNHNYDDIGQGACLFVPINLLKINAPNFMRPKGKWGFLFAIIARHSPNNISKNERMIEINRRFYRKALAIGSCHYPCDSIEKPHWQRHYGSHWQAICHFKKKYDPNNIFSPGFNLLC
jgi:FAD/FMN-containing dehydrogenase